MSMIGNKKINAARKTIFDGLCAAKGIEDAKSFTGLEDMIVSFLSNDVEVFLSYCDTMSESDFINMMSRVYRDLA